MKKITYCVPACMGLGFTDLGRDCPACHGMGVKGE